MSSNEEESFECGLCMEDVRNIADGAIWQCSEGHMQCDPCYQQLGGATAVLPSFARVCARVCACVCVRAHVCVCVCDLNTNGTACDVVFRLKKI